MTILKKGYTLTYKDNKIINSISKVKVNDNLDIRLIDGNMSVKVEKVGK